MEIKVIEKSKNKLVFEIPAADHTLCNTIVKKLWENKATKTAGYRVDHPLVGKPVIRLETSGDDPKKVLDAAVKALKKDNEALRKLAKKLK